MKHCNLLRKIVLLTLLLLLGTHTLRAQQQDPQQPQPQQPQDPQQPQPQDPMQPQPPPQEPEDNPYGSMPKPAGQALPYFDFGVGNGDLRPDFTPLTGMLNAGLGFPDVKHSYWVPGVQVASTAQSNLIGQTNVPSSGWSATNYVTGNVSLVEAWNRSQLALNYSGGGAFSTDSTVGASAFQQLAFAQSFQLNRWILQFVDEFSQLPQSGFGFGVGTSLGVPGVGGSLGGTIPGVGSNYNPNQSILGGSGPRISNVTVAQATYQLTRRSSITLSGSYGILHFLDPGNIDTDTVFTSLGYNYQLSRKDTIGFFYEFSSYHFPGSPQAFGVQTMSAAYSRKITGRMALSLYGGPQFTSFRIPPVGTTSTTTNGFYASAYLNYAFKNGVISGYFVHGISGGSGVLTGSILDELGLTATRRLSRQWAANVHFGYANNSSVVNVTGGTNPSYDNWYVGVGVSHPIGRDMLVALSYSAAFETNNPGCSPGSLGCGVSSNTTSQYVTLNFRWHPRPFGLQ